VPFHFWSVVIFVFGTIVGSFLNVPLLTWLYLRGKCANCREPISARYFLVELLTGLLFLGVWLMYGHQSATLVVVYCVLVGGLIVATFIDFEHFIIPDEITLGGIVIGFLFSFVVPGLHHEQTAVKALRDSFLGIAVGGGLIYGILRMGKLLFGRKKLSLPAETRVVFTETALVYEEKTIPFEDLFYRKSDTIAIEARYVELIDRCYRNIAVRLSPERLELGEEVMDPESVPHMEVVTEKMVLPQEAMGFGDVKFMAAIGAFLGWEAAVFSLMVSSIIGSLVGLTLIVLRRQEWSSRLPYGPYIALAALSWIFGGNRLFEWLFLRGA